MSQDLASILLEVVPLGPFLLVMTSFEKNLAFKFSLSPLHLHIHEQLPSFS